MAGKTNGARGKPRAPFGTQEKRYLDPYSQEQQEGPGAIALAAGDRAQVQVGQPVDVTAFQGEGRSVGEPQARADDGVPAGGRPVGVRAGERARAAADFK